MQTSFTLAQLADPDIAEADKILRACVHCGFCTATCPTYVLLGDELDSPRGRIYLIKDMLENDRPATEEVVKHIDRCLSCLACMTTCPSGVHYMHLVDHARAHIEETYRRPWPDRAMRALLAAVLPYPGRFRAALAAGWLAGPARRRSSRAGAVARKAVPVAPGLARHRCAALAAMLGLLPARLPDRSAYEGRGAVPAEGARKGRVALLQGCAQPVLAPSINEAAIRLLTRQGIEVVLAAGEGCCGSLVHHMGARASGARAGARQHRCVDARDRKRRARCNLDHGIGLRNNHQGLRLHAAQRSGLCGEGRARVARSPWTFPSISPRSTLARRRARAGLTVAYQSACSLQHGQKIMRQPKDLLAQLGFAVRELAEAHLCCGSAGTYNIMQPDIAARAARRARSPRIERTGADVIATGNIGCMTHIAPATAHPDRAHRRAARLGARRTGARRAASMCVSDANDSRRIDNRDVECRTVADATHGRAMNRREEDHHGCSQEESEEVEDRRRRPRKPPLKKKVGAKRSGAKRRRPRRKRRRRKTAAKKKAARRSRQTDTEAARQNRAPKPAARSRSTEAAPPKPAPPPPPSAARRRAESDHLSPVQSAGWRRQFG